MAYLRSPRSTLHGNSHTLPASTNATASNCLVTSKRSSDETASRLSPPTGRPDTSGLILVAPPASHAGRPTQEQSLAERNRDLFITRAIEDAESEPIGDGQPVRDREVVTNVS